VVDGESFPPASVNDSLGVGLRRTPVQRVVVVVVDDDGHTEEDWKSC